MKPEVNRTYNTRDGRIATVLGRNTSIVGNYPFIGMVEGKIGSCTWTENGSAWSSQVDGCDLIDEVRRHTLTVEEMPSFTHLTSNDGLTGTTVLVTGKPSWNFANLVRLQKAIHVARLELGQFQKAYQELVGTTDVDQIMSAHVARDVAAERLKRAELAYKIELETA